MNRLRVLVPAKLVALALLCALLTATPPSYAQLPPSPGGGLYKDPLHPLGTVNDNFDKHHIPSANSYKNDPNRHRDCGPAILMPRTDHQKTKSALGTPEAASFRQEQANKIANNNFAGALQMDLDDLTALKNAGQLQYDYTQAIQQAIGAMNNWMADCNQRKLSGGNPPVSGLASAPASIAAGSSVQVSGSGVAPSDEFDIVAADSTQLSQNPDWLASPRILSASPVLSNSSGAIAAQSIQLTARFYWESGGEEATLPLSSGQMKIGFVNLQGTAASNPASSTITGC